LRDLELTNDADSASDLTSQTDMVLAGGSLSILRRKKTKPEAEQLGDIRKLLSLDLQVMI
jgi:hypothetical protein